jgi:hypothetical protein
MPVHGGHVECFTAWGVPNIGFMRWVKRGVAAIVEPRCDSQVPLGGPTKVTGVVHCFLILKGVGLLLGAFICILRSCTVL